MFESMQNFLPPEWQATFTFFASGLAWIPAWQDFVLGFTLSGAGGWDAVLRVVFLFLPAVLLVSAMWCTMASLYTLPFRSGRGQFLMSLLMCWWDAGRTTWFFWAGMVRFVVVLVGWLWGLLKLSVDLVWKTIKGAATSPLALLDWTSRKYFQPGVPWIAFLLIIFWSAIEATIFTFTLKPTMSELLADMTGYELNTGVLSVMLWLFLFPIIAGSFACIQVLNEAIKSRQIGQVVSMALVEVVVAFFEVLFLYRELVDAITPWLAQQGLVLGIGGTLVVAFFGWVGVRGMTWFLFGRYGTPALLGVLARQTITRDQPGVAPDLTPPPTPDFWRAPINALKAETEWFKKEAREVFELLSLPVLQLLAAVVNFAVVVIRGVPHFALPFKSLDHVLAATPFANHAPRGTTRAVEGGVS